METHSTTTWRARGKRTSVIALGLVAILAGVAVAYFLSTVEFAGNMAKGGNLTVDTGKSLPIDFTGGGTACQTPEGTDVPSSCNVLFPTNNSSDSNGPTPATASAAISKPFTIKNGNTVDTAYIIYATCPLCTDTTNAGAAHMLDQYNHLYVRITKDKTPDSELAPGVAGCLDPAIQCNTDTVEYSGALSKLTAGAAAKLGTITHGTSQTYHVLLWLSNDANEKQPQTVLSNWSFWVGATLPA